MQFYQIHLKSLPEFKYAQRAECTNYTNVYACIKDYFEIVLIDDADPMYVCYKDHTEQSDYGTFFTIVQSMDMQVKVPGRNVHHTVGVKAQYTETGYRSETLSEQEILDILKNTKEEGCFLIPSLTDMSEHFQYIRSVMKHIAEMHHRRETGDKAACFSEWFELLAYLTRYTEKRLLCEHGKFSPSQHLYAEKTKKYIHQNLHRKLSAEEIATKLSISVNYLHKIFKLATGNTLTTYINRAKMEVAAEYIQKNNATGAEAAKYIGIEDALYFSRLFKQHYGVSVTEFKKHTNTFQIHIS